MPSARGASTRGVEHGRSPQHQHHQRPVTLVLLLALTTMILSSTVTAFQLSPLFHHRRAAAAVQPAPPLRAIRGIETFGGDFTLAPDSEAVLVSFLQGEEMVAEVLKQAKCTSAAFTGMLFQPVPYSPGTPHGMPQQFEPFYENAQFAICHVPPPVMFKARIFNPPRLCAIFEIAGVHPEEVARIEALRKARMPLAEQIKQLEDRVVGAEDVVRRIKGPENDWRSVGRALRDVVIEGLGSDEDDDPELDALVV